MPSDIQAIKRELDQRLGSHILVTQQTGRKRMTTRQGILSNTFPAVFVVELDQDENKFERCCFSYADVLTETIAIEFQ